MNLNIITLINIQKVDIFFENIYFHNLGLKTKNKNKQTNKKYDNEAKCSTFYSNSKAEIIIYNSHIDVFESLIYIAQLWQKY